MSADPNKVREFLDAFEEALDRDWVYTKQMPGIQKETEQQKIACTELGLEAIPIIGEDETFIHQKVEDEVEDWGNRAVYWQRIAPSSRTCSSTLMKALPKRTAEDTRPHYFSKAEG